MNVPFNRPPYTGNEDQYVVDAMRSSKLSGDGPYTKRCQDWFQRELGSRSALLTPSCTHALELAAILIDTRPGDEIIMPSYTFVSTANAFALRGASIVFVDVRPDTMNLDETLLEQAITERTKAIVPVHYAGVACDMEAIMAIAARHDLYVIEDAAQGMKSTYQGRPLGTFGHLAAYSFHDTKNYTSGGEGGLLIVNDSQFVERAEILREKGTNRSQFLRGAVDKYSWVDIGSSYLPGELQAAYLWGQLEKADEINAQRMAAWGRYRSELDDLGRRGAIELGVVPPQCRHNAHMFYVKAANIDERTELIAHLKDQGVQAAFHYVPLHSAKAGLGFGRFCGEDRYTTSHSERLLRLPLWFGIDEAAQQRTVDALYGFYR